MAKNRKVAEEWFLSFIEQLTPGSNNKKLYQEFFSSMNDKEFEQFVDDLASGKKSFSVEMPNFANSELSVKRNLDLAKKIGLDLFQKLWIEGKDDLPTYQTPVEYMVVDLPYRRASQLLTKKISVPKHNKIVDALTGQPTGDSKGAKISYPEIQVLSAMGLDKSLLELLKYRGGDDRGRAAMNTLLTRNGNVRLDTLTPYSSGVTSTAVLSTFLTAAHLKNNLASKTG